MKLILRSKTDNNFISISIKTTEPYDSCFEKLKNDIKHPKTGTIILYDEQISSYDLAKIKRIFEKLEITDFQIYSNSRETISTGKSLKIWDGTYQKSLENDSDIIKTLMKTSESSLIIYPSLIRKKVENQITLIRD